MERGSIKYLVALLCITIIFFLIGYFCCWRDYNNVLGRSPVVVNGGGGLSSSDPDNLPKLTGKDDDCPI
ncbi:hypothetical protein MIMGU_mgv1a025222mg [Erythranthe guttata]|uniref:Uncharacterized protein n=1 Tax=Erythranthe guttata TaxID=4155 RepID=A0A022QSI2_ERYGU|nr:hypothetical protein MIMGU_mgv1a025222mg [Erythranthe guttata]